MSFIAPLNKANLVPYRNIIHYFDKIIFKTITHTGRSHMIVIVIEAIRLCVYFINMFLTWG